MKGRQLDGAVVVAKYWRCVENFDGVVKCCESGCDERGQLYRNPKPLKVSGYACVVGSTKPSSCSCGPETEERWLQHWAKQIWAAVVAPGSYRQRVAKKRGASSHWCSQIGRVVRHRCRRARHMEAQYRDRLWGLGGHAIIYWAGHP